MGQLTNAAAPREHSHRFLGASHEHSERKVWTVIWLCTAMMIAEIAGGLVFGSIALVADGLHMSTHTGALLLAAGAYTFSRRYGDDARFSFGTGKLGDLAGFSSAILLAMVALLIGYESVMRIANPVTIHFAEAIPIAYVGLAVNIVSAWLLSAGEHSHSHVHVDEAVHGHAAAHRDNNMRAAAIHVIADAAVSFLVIVGLLLARTLGWLWMDPLAGIVGACVIGSWSFGLIRDTGAVLLDMNPDPKLATRLRETLEREGDRVVDLHLWRLGPGHLGAIVSVETAQARGADYYRAELTSFCALSHLTIEVRSI